MKTDWDSLKNSIIIFSMCLLLCSILVYVAYYFHMNMEKVFNQDKNLLESIKRQHVDTALEKKILSDYYPRFIELYNKGVIGSEKRLNWIEVLRQASEKIGISELTYSVESRKEYIPPYPVDYSGYKLYISEMKLTLGLLHEGDLFRLLNEFDKNAKGLFTVNECSFERNNKEIKFDLNHANIMAICDLYWITINLPEGKEIEI